MKILVLQYEADGGGVVIPSNTGRDIDILLPSECTHILIVKEEAPRIVKTQKRVCKNISTYSKNIRSFIFCCIFCMSATIFLSHLDLTTSIF